MIEQIRLLQGCPFSNEPASKISIGPFDERGRMLRQVLEVLRRARYPVGASVRPTQTVGKLSFKAELLIRIQDPGPHTMCLISGKFR